jgi:hypothetical protein
MKYALEIVSGAIMYISSFIEIGSDIQKLTGGIYRQKLRQNGDRTNLLLFFEDKGIRLKIEPTTQLHNHIAC